MVCEQWEGTRYALNRRTMGVSVDCVHFVARVLDVLHGSDCASSLQSLLPDACVHDRMTVLQMLRRWLRFYPHERVRDHVVEAGDVLVYRPAAGAATASHIAIVGSPGRIWHATAPRVCCTGVDLPGLYLLAIYRTPCKRQWLQC